MPTNQQLMEILEMAAEAKRLHDRCKTLFASYGMELIYVQAREFKYRWVALFEIEPNHYWAAKVDVEFADMPKSDVFKQRIHDAFEKWLKENPKDRLLSVKKVKDAI